MSMCWSSWCRTHPSQAVYMFLSWQYSDDSFLTCSPGFLCPTNLRWSAFATFAFCSFRERMLTVFCRLLLFGCCREMWGWTRFGWIAHQCQSSHWTVIRRFWHQDCAEWHPISKCFLTMLSFFMTSYPKVTHPASCQVSSPNYVISRISSLYDHRQAKYRLKDWIAFWQQKMVKIALPKSLVSQLEQQTHFWLNFLAWLDFFLPCLLYFHFISYAEPNLF